MVLCPLYSIQFLNPFVIVFLLHALFTWGLHVPLYFQFELQTVTVQQSGIVLLDQVIPRSFAVPLFCC